MTDREIFIDFITQDLKYLTWREFDGLAKDKLISKDFKRNGKNYVIMGRFNQNNYINAVLLENGKLAISGGGFSLKHFLSMAKGILEAKE